ncbi:glycosyltransferase [Paenibacillus piri]|uniref:Glycosyltransferase family 1 protein n=1 Tax=Paenibacillus piri TaxID=2547395 RepID=A0A4R5KD57_9BACL|nr:glycosyltransferase [Paenibacillus piri]TDF92565.1 glycosyltransferase family 1 protein [Paenibacillus piri]
MPKKKRNTSKSGSLPVKKKPASMMLNKLHDLTPIHLEAPIIISRSVPMRILMVIDQFNIGGTETYSLSIARELVRKGATVVIAGKRGKLLDHFLGLGCPYYEIDFVLDNHQADHKNLIPHLNLLTSVMLTERIDLVHCHQIPSGRLALRAAAQLHVPFVFTAHGTYYDRDFLQQLLQAGAALTCVSPSIQRLLQAKGINAKLIANGLDDREYHAYDQAYLDHFRSKLGIPADAAVVLYAGRLSWEKGDICEEIIHTVSAMRSSGYAKLHLIIAGGGSKQAALFQLAQEKRLLSDAPFIHCTGEVLNMALYYSVSDCVIGTGRVALEAMSCERPLIAVGSRGFLGIVNPDNYEKAWDSWFADHDADQKLTRALLADHLKAVLLMDPQARLKLVRKGKKFIINRFPIHDTVEPLLDVYYSSMSHRTAQNGQDALRKSSD